MKRRLPRPALCLAALWGLVALGTAPLAGQERPPSTAETSPAGNHGIAIERIEIGLAGHYKVGEWTALRLVVRAATPQQVSVVVEAPDSDDNLALLPSRLFDLPANVPTRLESCFRTGRQHGELRIRLVDPQGGLLLERPLRTSEDESAVLRPALRHDVPLWVTLPQLPDLESGPARARSEARSAALPTAESSYEPQVARLQSLAELPEHPKALESVDILVLPTAPRADGASLLAGMTAQHDRVLHDWVRGGGHLLVTVAQAANEYRESPLAAWVPIEVAGRGSLRQFTGLESFSGISVPLRTGGSQPVARLAPLTNGKAIVKEGNAVLIAAAPYGFGRVTLAGIDLETPPFSTWSALPSVLRKLAGAPGRATQQAARQPNRQLSQTGITDIATQLQTAREDFPAVARPSHWWVMGLLIAYLLVIGPLDYFVVHRWLRRPELTWLTFPLLVCLGAGAATWGATRANARGLKFNQLDLVDYDASTKSCRGRTWISIYSPENRRYEIAVKPGPVKPSTAKPGTATPVTLTWSGVPENSVSGVYRPGGAGGSRREYAFSTDATQVENLPILQWSTKSLCATWESDVDSPPVESRLETAGPGQIRGTLTHHLPETLEDCLLIVGGWAYAPTRANASIAPDVAWTPGGPQGRARDLKALLTGERRTRKENGKLQTEVLTTTAPYNPFNVNPVDLIQMISFHQVAGGSEYTGLANAALRDLELTHLMKLGRGILIGRIKSPQAQVAIDGQTPTPADAAAFVRLIVPVTNIERAPAATIPKAGEREPSGVLQ
ncbi:MAG: hypothetical protein EXS05_01485 [Planctomycetaceae bacterium]|nr:hypothetical protein [Planctomycetaceae bacterium]